MTLRNKALKLGASEFGISNRRTKKFFVSYNDKIIHFGAKGFSDYTQHKDKERRDRYRSRHKKIRLKDGSYAYKNKNQPAFWAYNILWT